MKTSNKLLCLGSVFFTAAMLFGLLVTKNNMNIVRLDKSTKGNKILVTKTLKSNLESSVLNLSDPYRFILDPTTSDVSVTCDENLINDIRLNDEGVLSFYREGDLHWEPSEKPVVLIGVKNKLALNVILNNNSKLESEKPLTTELIIDAEDRTYFDLILANSSTVVNMENRARGRIIGSSQKLVVNAEDNSNLRAKELEVVQFNCDLKDYVMVYANEPKNVIINLEDQAQVYFEGQWDEQSLRVEDRSRIIVAGEELRIN